MFSDTEDLEQLADSCLATARVIKEHLAANGQPQMSFDQNGPSTFPDVPPNVQYARLILRDAAQRLVDLAAGPDEAVGYHPYACSMDINAFRYIHRFNIAAAIPPNSTITYTDLAAKCAVDITQLKQSLHQLMMIRVFHEPTPNHVAHTAASLHLTRPGVRAFNTYVCTETFAVIANNLAAIDKWGHGSQEPNQTGLQLAYNTDKYMYDYYETDQHARERFSDLMAHISTSAGMAASWVAAGYNWAGLGACTVVDVAGSLGACSVPIAQANPSAQIIVQDLPGTIARANDPATNTVIPESLRSRFTFMAHDFYSPTQPINADVFFVRMIMHDYSDAYCVKILRPLVAALKPGGRIVIMDQVLPPVGGAPYPLERFMRAQDMQMGLLTNAKERDREQWEELLGKTDQRLRISSVATPPGSVMALIEVVLVEEGTGNGHAR